MDLSEVPTFAPDGSRASLERLARLGLAYSLAHDLNHLAHDLRSPLQSLLMASDALSDPLALDPSMQATVRSMLQKSSGRVESALYSLRFPDLSDSESGAQALCEVLSDTVSMWQLQHQLGQSELSIDLPEDLPAIEAPRGDLSYVLLQLLLNAVEADVGGTVTVDARVVADEVLLRVIDQGAGVDKDMQAQLFKPFESTKSKANHLGVGLAVSAGLMAFSEIALSLEFTAPGQGSVFALRFPISHI